MKTNRSVIISSIVGLLLLGGFIQFINFSFLNLGKIETGRDEIDSFSDDIFITPILDYPTYPGCEGLKIHQDKVDCFRLGLSRFMELHFRYPKDAIKVGLEGKVYVRFKINKDGNVVDSEVIRGEHDILNLNALELVNRLPKMSPAIQNNKPVFTQFTIPINYNLPKVARDELEM